jgi:hypothetical protein
MYIHIGNNVLVSGNKCVGIFNIETLKLSDVNKWMLEKIKDDDRTLSLDTSNNIAASEISSYTIIKRTPVTEDELLWSKK